MFIRPEILGLLRTNTYTISDDNRNAYIIDPAMSGTGLSDYIKSEKLKLHGIILTHFHLDHLLGIVDFEDVPIYISATDGEFLRKKETIGLMREGFYTDDFISKEDSDKLADFIQKCKMIKVCEGYVIPNFSEPLKILLTPGHSAGSMCIYAPQTQVLFSGDTLFCRTYGRTDLPTSNENEMMKSLKKLAQLPPDTDVMPGHGEATMIEEELDRGILKLFK